jgi:hypothetical protein
MELVVYFPSIVLTITPELGKAKLHILDKKIK